MTQLESFATIIAFISTMSLLIIFDNPQCRIHRRIRIFARIILALFVISVTFLAIRGFS